MVSTTRVRGRKFLLWGGALALVAGGLRAVAGRGPAQQGSGRIEAAGKTGDEPGQGRSGAPGLGGSRMRSSDPVFEHLAVTDRQVGPSLPLAKDIAVRVIDEHGRPLERVRVRIRAAEDPLRVLEEGYTEADGLARIGKTAAGSQVIDLYLRDYRVREARDDGGAACTFVMVSGSPVSGRVVAEEGGGPISDASVQLHEWAMESQVGPTDRDGRFDVGGVCLRDDPALLIQARGFQFQEVHLAGLEAGTLDRLVVRMRRGRVCRGIVLDPDGEGAANAEAVFTAVAGERGVSARQIVARCDPDGAFEVRELVPDTTYRVDARAHGYAPAVGVECAGGSADEAGDYVRLRLRRPCGLRVLVVDRDSENRLPRARVLIARGDQTTLPPKLTEQGVFEWTDLEPGRLLVCAGHASHVSGSEVVSLEEGTQEVRTLRLPAGIDVSGRVLTPSGEPAMGVLVQGTCLNPESGAPLLGAGWTTSRFTDEAGAFQLDGLGSTRVLLRASWPAGGGADIGASATTVGTPKADVELRIGGVRALRASVSGWSSGEEHPNTAWIELEYPGQGLYGQEVEVFDGALAMPGVAGDPTALVVSLRGYAWIRKTLEPPLRDVIDLGVLHLERGRAVSGVVVDRWDMPLSAASVNYVLLSNAGARCSAEGRFVLEHAPSHEFDLRAECPGYCPRCMTVGRGTPGELRVVLTESVGVRARLPAWVGEVGGARLQLRRGVDAWPERAGVCGARDVVEVVDVPIDLNGVAAGDVVAGTWTVTLVTEAGGTHALGAWAIGLDHPRVRAFSVAR